MNQQTKTLKAMALFIVCLFICTITACTKEPVETSQTNNKDFYVQTLFTHEGITVYRFFDGGDARYFTSCRETMFSNRHGKAETDYNIK